MAELISDEWKHAQRFIASTEGLTEKESEIIAKTFAAGISQIAHLRTPLILEALRLETPNQLV